MQLNRAFWSEVAFTDTSAQISHIWALTISVQGDVWVGFCPCKQQLCHTKGSQKYTSPTNSSDFKWHLGFVSLRVSDKNTDYAEWLPERAERAREGENSRGQMRLEREKREERDGREGYRGVVCSSDTTPSDWRVSHPDYNRSKHFLHLRVFAQILAHLPLKCLLPLWFSRGELNVACAAESSRSKRLAVTLYNHVTE